jgi:hypothetical protein
MIYRMSVQEILDNSGKIALRFVPNEALNSVENPLTATLSAYNPVQLVKHDISGAGTVEAAVIQTETLELVPGSLQLAIRSDESIEFATGKRLEFQAAGEVAVASGQSLTLGGTLVAPDVAAAGAPHANVLGFNTVTGDIEYQAAGGGGGVTNPLSAALDCGTFNLDNVGQLNFNAVAEINAAAGNDVTITAGVGGTITLDAGSVSSLTMNSAIPAVSLKPDAGFCELLATATVASVISGNKDVKLVLEGAANTVALQTAATRGVFIDDGTQLVSIQANAGTTAMSLNGGFGGSAAIAANGNASIVLDSTGGGRCEVTAADSFRLTGANLQSATSSGASGVFLRIQLNSVYYKIPLELD